MNILVVGSGGREHAVIKKLRENTEVKKIYALPGNGGIAADAECVNIGATDIDGIAEFANNNQIDYAVVTPDDPLVLGCVDRLESLGIPCFGPRKNAAIIEGSKVFSKNLMKKYGIPTAQYEVFDSAEDALAYLDSAPIPTVIKADGLALGKGVVVAQTVEEAKAAVRAMIEDKTFGQSGTRVVIEEYMEGPEVSVLSFTDGEALVPMVSSMDHKRALDGDKGPNTGGMGAFAPSPLYNDEIAERTEREILLPTLHAMNAEGFTFKGVLYVGLMLTAEGPKVVEYNARFGDPETQVVLPLLESDLLTVMMATAEGRLSEVPVKFSDKSACCVIIASKGYPVKYESGCPLMLPTDGEDGFIYVAGAKKTESGLVSAGGRVLGVTATADSLREAVDAAYAKAAKVKFDNGFYRKDIGARALAAKK